MTGHILARAKSTSCRPCILLALSIALFSGCAWPQTQLATVFYREGEPQILERMRQLRAEGLAYGAIAEQMNAEGSPTRTRGRWHPQAVHRILNRNQATKHAH